MHKSLVTVGNGPLGADKTTTFTGDPAPAQSSWRMVRDVAELAAIFEPTVNVVSLRRARSEALIEACRCALIEPGFRKWLTVPSGPAGLRDIHDVLTGLPALADDVHFWVDVLADLTGSEGVGVRLARVESAMCPRFHVDRVTLRVVCTYEGRGTEFISNEHVDRRRLGHAAGGASDETSGLLLIPDCVRTAEPGDVVLLKGEAWADIGGGAVHRSPAVSSASPRLVMTLDPL